MDEEINMLANVIANNGSFHSQRRSVKAEQRRNGTRNIGVDDKAGVRSSFAD